MDTLFARTSWFFDPHTDRPAFRERRAPRKRGQLDSETALEALTLVTGGPTSVRASVALTADQRAAAARLVESRYGWRGYAVQPDERASATVLVATQDHAAVGTLTLHIDGPDGLAADDGYGAAIDVARADGRRVCELTRLAIDSTAASQPTLGALIGLAYLVGRAVHQVTDVFVEVNPRHARFYQRTFGFVAAAGQRICARVAAPAVLLRLELQRFDEMVARADGWRSAFESVRAAA